MIQVNTFNPKASAKKRHRYRERLRKKILVKRSDTMKFCVELLSLT
jgi:hypothetical protein